MSEPTGKPRILVIDDEPMILQILQAAFERKEWEVEFLGEGRAAMRRHRAAPFDLIIVDKNLPDIDGVSLVRELRAEGDAVRVVMVTGYGTVASAVESLNLGVAAYLEKPLRRITEVAATVEAALARPTTLPKRATIPRLTVRPRAVTQPRVSTPSPREVAEAAGAVRPPHGSPPGHRPDVDEFDAEVLTGRWRRPVLPAGTVVIGAAEDDVRASLGAVVSAARCEPVFAGDTEELLVALASHEPVLAVLVGALGAPENVARLRAQAPDFPCAVIADKVTVAAVKELMQLRTNNLITDSPRSEAAHARLAEILRGLTAGEGMLDE